MPTLGNNLLGPSAQSIGVLSQISTLRFAHKAVKLLNAAPNITLVAMLKSFS